MAGHLFVTRGDLTKLACDAWLLPTDAFGTVKSPWSSVVAELPQPRSPGWGEGTVRAFALPGAAAMGAPTPWPTNVGADPSVGPEWFLEGVRQFVEGAGAASRLEPAANGRTCPLLALPVVGTGAGGAAHLKGEMTRRLVGELAVLAERGACDLVLVTHDDAALAAAQSARAQLLESGGARLWPELGDGLRGAAEALARDALEGRLVLFLGAGIGVGAGLPLWDQLLEQLAERAGFTEPERASLAAGLHVTDQARIIQRRLAARGVDLGDAVADSLSATRASLAHQLLAGLPVREAATTNYDALYETACRDAGRAIAVLPYEPTRDADGWLLKMHGSVDHRADIVLTRDDYMSYAGRRAALAGIVQALLITRRMLFVGFSLSDDNFHRIAHDVRQALGSSRAPDPFGTALLLRPEPGLEELWHDEVSFVSTGGDADVDVRASARRLDIFLDYLLFRASSGTGHLLTASYEGVLTPDEVELREDLARFLRDAGPGARRAAAWKLVEALIRRLGGGPET